MKISTRGRYAIRVMLDLAEHNTGEYIPLMDIARRQEISEKYLESIVSVLSKINLSMPLGEREADTVFPERRENTPWAAF